MNSVLIMAGGESSRMRKTTSKNTHKALIEIFNISLLEINILYAYLYGLKDIWISVAVIELELIERIRFLQEHYLKELNVRIELIVENIPFGTIGAVQFVRSNSEELLVLNVDNLLDINLTDFINSHRKNKADMTIASHEELFKIPFGQLVIKDETVIDYLEKPSQIILISSGTYVLGPEARNVIAGVYSNRRIDIPELSKYLITNHFKVKGYNHNSMWADINDKESLSKVMDMHRWPLLSEICKIQTGLKRM